MKNNPAWLSEAIFYKTYPQSFLDTNGDIQGIIDKLDSIPQSQCKLLVGSLMNTEKTGDGIKLTIGGLSCSIMIDALDK